MTQQRHFAAPRAQVLFRFTTEAIRNSGLDDQSFAAAVAEAYMASVAPPERIVAFHVGSDMATIDQANKRNAKLIERFRNGTVKLPADLEEAWVAALPEPWRTDCARELARRYGFMGARHPERQPGSVLSTARMCIELGESLQAMAQISPTGSADGCPLPALRKAVKEMQDLQAEVTTLLAGLDQAIEARTTPRAVAGGEPR